MLAILTSILQMCSPAPAPQTLACSEWLFACVMKSPTHDDFALENCMENLPEPLWPK